MKKDEKKKWEDRLRAAQQSCAYWNMVSGEAPHVIRDCDERIAFLEAKKKRWLADVEKAPTQLAKFRREFEFVKEQLESPRVQALQDNTDKFIKLAEKLASMEVDLEQLNLTPEQLELIRKMAELKKV